MEEKEKKLIKKIWKGIHDNDLETLIDCFEALKCIDGDINTVDMNGDNFLHLSAVPGCDFSIFNFFLNEGVNYHTIDDLDMTPLLIALCGEDKDKVLSILKKGIVLDPEVEKNLSSLHESVKSRMGREIFELLLESGGDINIKDENGDTPLHVYIRERDDFSLDDFRYYIEEAGANPEIKNNEGKDIKEEAIIKGNNEAVKLIQNKNKAS